nr:rho GTPase-activating protein 22 [Pogona vitticeps]
MLRPCHVSKCCATTRGIFGQRLEETVQYEKKYGQHLAPLLVEQCVDFIRKHGLMEEGLFRMPGQANLVKELQDSFDSGEKPLFDSHTDVHTVASLLKLYLRELPEPVIPFTRYEDFLSCGQLLSKDRGEGTLELAKHVKNLPQANYNLLKYICNFLDEVQSHSSHNKMSVQNLATVFGPNILRSQVEDPVTIMESNSLVQHLMTALISEHGQIFADSLTKGSDNQLEAHCRCPHGVMDWISKDGRSENKLESSIVSPINFPPEAPSPATAAVIQEGHGKRTCDRSAANPSKGGQMFPTWKYSFQPQDAESLRHKMGGTLLNSPSLPSSGNWLMNGLYSLHGHYRPSSGGLLKDSRSSQRLSIYDNVPISTPSFSTHINTNNVTRSTSSCEISATIDSISSCAAHRATDSSTFSSLPMEWVTYNSLLHSESSQGDSMERPEEPSSSNSDQNSLAIAPKGAADCSGDLQSLIAELKAKLSKQRAEYESTLKRTEKTSTELRMKVARLEEELDQEKKKYMLLEIKLRNSERARKDADRRNYLLQEEMETFFTTLGNLTLEGALANIPK